jgi:hypothetical protein
MYKEEEWFEQNIVRRTTTTESERKHRENKFDKAIEMMKEKKAKITIISEQR